MQKAQTAQSGTRTSSTARNDDRTETQHRGGYRPRHAAWTALSEFEDEQEPREKAVHLLHDSKQTEGQEHFDPSEYALSLGAQSAETHSASNALTTLTGSGRTHATHAAHGQKRGQNAANGCRQTDSRKAHEPTTNQTAN